LPAFLFVYPAVEITIDFEAVRAVLRDEYERMSAETRALGPLRALVLSQQRHDVRLATATDAHTLSCREGCSWCCHFRVDVRSVELVQILRFVREHLPAEEQQRLFRSVSERAELIATLSEEEHLGTNIACAFLTDGRCSIYSVRPQTCRNYHATRVDGCRQSFDDPQNSDIDPEYAPGVYQAGGSHVDAVASALKDAGFDVSVHEMHTGLAAIWQTPDAAAHRFEMGRAPLENAHSFEPETEFRNLIG
jgi:Fe-S-cluster containining protein